MADVELVLVVADSNRLYEVVRLLADLCDQIGRTHLFEIEVSVSEREVDYVHERLYHIELSHELLPQLQVLLPLKLHVVLILGEAAGEVMISVTREAVLGVAYQEFLDPV